MRDITDHIIKKYNFSQEKGQEICAWIDKLIVLIRKEEAIKVLDQDGNEMEIDTQPEKHND